MGPSVAGASVISEEGCNLRGDRGGGFSPKDILIFACYLVVLVQSGANFTKLECIRNPSFSGKKSYKMIYDKVWGSRKQTFSVDFIKKKYINS